MLNGKDFVSRNLFGERFDKNVYRNGYDIREQQLYKALHSKLPKRASIDYGHIDSFTLKKSKGEELKINKRPLWKYGYQNKNEFGPFLVDKEYIFDLPKKKKLGLSQPPFRRPKEEGDYFDKDIHILGGN